MRSCSEAADALRARLGCRPWRLLRDDPTPGAWNMAVDAALLHLATDGAGPFLRFYGWDPPAVSVGRFQDPARGIDWAAVAARGWHGVRRPTGGRAVLHHLELTYAIALPPDVVGGCGVAASYEVLRGGVAFVLRRLTRHTHWRGYPPLHRLRGEGERARLSKPALEREGCAWESMLPLSLSTKSVERRVPAPVGVAGEALSSASSTANCFARVAPSDIATTEGKIVGSAQARRRGALLQHGSILLDIDPEAWAAIFGDAGEAASLRELTGAAPERDALAEALAAALAETWGLRLSPSDLGAAEAAAARGMVERFELWPGGRPTKFMDAL